MAKGGSRATAAKRTDAKTQGKKSPQVKVKAKGKK